MDTNVNLCMGCMNELDSNGVCHYCSYTNDSPYLQSYLAPRTILDDRYIVGKMLSYNGEGASYICYDLVGKTKVVVREYMPDVLCEREFGTQKLVVNPDCLAKYKTYMSEFADMNKTLSKMRNLTHISTAIDMFVENNTTYAVLEYVEGVSLKKFLQSNTGFLTWNQVKKLFVPLFTTLSIIHNSGIIHRGISLENIIVTTDGELKLTGFSISSIRTANTGLSPEFYSGYTAPEQYSSLEYQGTWTDVYAVAAVLYRILTGCTPPDACSRVRNDTLVEAKVINPSIPSHISDVLSRALILKGENRTHTINELVSELFAYSNHVEHQKGATQTIPIQKTPQKRQATAPIPRVQEPAVVEKKTSTATLVMGILLLILFLGVGFFLLYQLIASPRKDGSSSSSLVAFDSYDNISENVIFEGSSSEVESNVTTNDSDNSENPYGFGSIMPNVIGQRYETVVQRIGNEFNIRAKYFYSDVDEKGIITEQSIPEGTEYDPGKKNELVLKVCRGSENVPVPDYFGLSEKDYLAILGSLDIKYKVEKVVSDIVPQGYVESTDIDVGYNINVKEGQVLTVRVSHASDSSSKTDSSQKDDLIVGTP